jgi:hypothetical protein
MVSEIVLKDTKGNIIDRNGYDTDFGDIFYKDKKVGSFELSCDDEIGSYYIYIMDNGEEFNDHYVDDKELIKACNI